MEEPATAETLGQDQASRPFDGDWVKTRRPGNWAILAVLVGIGFMFYFITVIRIEEGARVRAEAEALRAAEQAVVEATLNSTADEAADTTTGIVASELESAVEETQSLGPTVDNASDGEAAQ